MTMKVILMAYCVWGKAELEAPIIVNRVEYNRTQTTKNLKTFSFF